MTVTARTGELETVLAAIRACRRCVEAPQGRPLPHEPRPVLRASARRGSPCAARRPERGCMLRARPSPTAPAIACAIGWASRPQEFYDEARVAIVPMGFCFPGQDEKGGDLPPRRECAGLWHRQLVRALPQIELVLAVGPTRKASISATQREQSCKRRCSTGGSICGGRRATARPAAAAPLLAEQCVADEEPVVRGGAVAGAAPRSEEAAVTFRACGAKKIIY